MGLLRALYKYIPDIIYWRRKNEKKPLEDSLNEQIIRQRKCVFAAVLAGAISLPGW